MDLIIFDEENSVPLVTDEFDPLKPEKKLNKYSSSTLHIPPPPESSIDKNYFNSRRCINNNPPSVSSDVHLTSGYSVLNSTNVRATNSSSNDIDKIFSNSADPFCSLDSQSDRAPQFYSFFDYLELDELIYKLKNLHSISDESSNKELKLIQSLAINPIISQNVEYPIDFVSGLNWEETGASQVCRILSLTGANLSQKEPTMPNVHLKISYNINILFDNQNPDACSNINGQWIIDKDEIISKRDLDVNPHNTKVYELIAELLALIANPDCDLLFNPSNFRLRILGRMEFLNPYAKLCQHSYFRFCHRMGKDIRLIIEPNNYKGSLLSSASEYPKTIAFHEELNELYSVICPTYDYYTKERGDIFSIINNIIVSSINNNYYLLKRHEDSSEKDIFNLKISLTRFIQLIKATCMGLSRNLTSLDLLQLISKLQGFQIRLQEMQNKKPESFSSIAEQLSKSLILIDKTLASQLNAYRLWMQLPGAFAIDRQNALSSFKNHTNLSSSENIDSVILRNKKKDSYKHQSFSDFQSMNEWEFQKTMPVSSRDCISSMKAGEESLLIRVLCIHWTSQRTPLFNSHRKFMINNQRSSSSKNNDRVPINSQSNSPSVGAPVVYNSLPFLNSSSEDCHTFRNQKTDYYFIRMRLMYAGRPLEKINHTRKYHRSPFQGLSCSDISPAGLVHVYEKFPSVLRFTHEAKLLLIRELPRETLLSISVVHSKKMIIKDYEMDESSLVAWVNIPVFDSRARLRQGRVFAGLWPVTDDLCAEMRTMYAEPNRSDCCPVIELMFPELDMDIEFPVIDSWLIKSTNEQTKDSLCIDSIHPNLRNVLYNSMRSNFFQRINKEDANRYAKESLDSLKEILNRTSLKFPIFSYPVASEIETIDSQILKRPCAVDCQLSMPIQSSVDILWNFRASLITNPDILTSLLINILIAWPTECKTQTVNTEFLGIGLPWSEFLDQIYDLMSSTSCPTSVMALWLLGAGVADQGIRYWAVRALANAPPDSLIIYLPQLIQLLNYDLYFDSSGLFSLLIHRSYTSVQFANALYWHIYSLKKHFVWHMNHRALMLLSAVKSISSFRLNKVWKRQVKVVDCLSVTAHDVKKIKDSSRSSVLTNHLSKIDKWLKTFSISDYVLTPESSPEHPSFDTTLTRNSNGYIFLRSSYQERSTIESQSNISEINDIAAASNDEIWLSNKGQFESGMRMPFNLGSLVNEISINECSYFSSYTKPLKLVFKAPEPTSDPTQIMFKVGDDLRLDSLICQLLRVMDQIWLDNGFDHHMVHFQVMPTGEKAGIIELVPDCFTLMQIQKNNGGLSGPFNDKTVTLWLNKNNRSNQEYFQALKTFMHSTVACCVTTYILGIGDRHNENIMIRNTGHMFHIDFAKVFGNGQKFLGINRDRVPFVFTSDMLYVIRTYLKHIAVFKNQPDENLDNKFIEMCCTAYNNIRDNMFTIFGLVETATQFGIPEVSSDAIKYLNKVLQPSLSHLQAQEHFSKLIMKSLESYSTKLNFLIHDWAKRTEGGGTQGTGSASSLTSNAVDFNWNEYSEEETLSPDNKLVEESRPLFVLEDGVNKKLSTSSPILPYVDASEIAKVSTRLRHFPQNSTHLKALDISFKKELRPVESIPKNLEKPNSYFDFSTKITSPCPGEIIRQVSINKPSKTSDPNFNRPLDYYYPIDIKIHSTSNKSDSTRRIYRSVADIFELMKLILNTFPNNSLNVSGELCQKLMLNDGAKTDITAVRLNSWLNNVIETPELIESDILATFLETAPCDNHRDETPVEKDFNPFKEKTSLRESSLPSRRVRPSPAALELKLCVISINKSKQLNIHVKRALNLVSSFFLFTNIILKKLNNFQDVNATFVQVILIFDQIRDETTLKSSQLMTSCDPSYKFSVQYNLDGLDLNRCDLELSVCYWNDLKECKCIGRVLIHCCNLPSSDQESLRYSLTCNESSTRPLTPTSASSYIKAPEASIEFNSPPKNLHSHIKELESIFKD